MRRAWRRPGDAWSFRDPRNEILDALCDDSVGSRLVIPVTNGSVTVTEQEIALEIGADDTHLFATPPIRLQWSPISLPNQAGQGDSALSAAKGAPNPKVPHC